MKKISFILIIFFSGIKSEATIRNVPSVYTTIQTALDSCAAGDTVLVQPGTYFENIVWPFQLGLKLLSAGDSSNTFINGSGIGIVLTINLPIADSLTVIKGFTITNGYSDVIGGGGISIYGGSPRIEEVCVRNNHISLPNDYALGAGIFSLYSNFIMRNSSIMNNHIDQGDWGYGGGVFIEGGNPTFENVKINNNIIQSSWYAFGGGVYLWNVENATFNNVEVNGNHINSWQYNSWCGGAGIYCGSYWNIQGIFNSTFINVKVTGNSSGNDPGYHNGMGMLFEKCNAFLTNVLVASNTMGLSSAPNGWYSGAGIQTDGLLGPVLIKLSHVTITDNKSLNTVYVSGTGFACYDSTTAIIKNCIFWNDTVGNEIDTFGIYPVTVNVYNSDIRGGFSGSANINVNPAFVSNSDFHLTPGSPCVNTGNLLYAPSFDLDMMPRPAPAGTNPDMGCYELNQPLSVNETNGENNLFEISPNPAKELLIISYPLTQNQKTLLTITDAKGKIILSKQLPQHTSNYKLQTSNFSQGIYFVEVNNGKEKTVKKFLKE